MMCLTLPLSTTVRFAGSYAARISLASTPGSPMWCCARRMRAHSSARVGGRAMRATCSVVPNEHVENLYSLEPPLLGQIYEVVRRVAVALREAYRCEGVSTRQHNEPASHQEVWHFHCHVFPRYAGDGLYERSNEHRWTTPEERAPYAEKLRAWLEQ
jgi:diadenosine tetraphosphate (Ap4A) HIT family hydrolase